MRNLANNSPSYKFGCINRLGDGSYCREASCIRTWVYTSGVAVLTHKASRRPYTALQNSKYMHLLPEFCDCARIHNQLTRFNLFVASVQYTACPRDRGTVSLVPRLFLVGGVRKKRSGNQTKRLYGWWFTPLRHLYVYQLGCVEVLSLHMQSTGI